MSWPVVALRDVDERRGGRDLHRFGEAGDRRREFNRCRLARDHANLLARLVLKPWICAPTRVLADGASASSFAMPSVSVTTVRLVMVSVAEAVTVAPGMRPPSLSATTTVMVPVLVTCANAIL